MSEKDNMLAGKLYLAGDEELTRARLRARALTREFNATTEEQDHERTAILRELLGSMGDNIFIEPTFRCDYGHNITLGDNVYVNFDCTFLDVNTIDIGRDVMIGPNVGLYTAGHPLDAGVRASLLEYGKSIRIGDGAWLGGHVVVNAGVSIGAGAVIGAGSVVTKDIPAGVIAVGNPCKVLRELTQEDAAYWQRLRDEHDGN